MAAPLPPVSRSFPTGDFLQSFADPYKFLATRVPKLGPVFTTNLFNTHIVAMISAEANRYVLASHAKNFRNREGYATLQSLYGDALLLTDDEQHARQRRLLNPAFHGRNMPAYLQRINQTIDARFDTWGTQGQRSFYLDSRHIAFSLATGLLLGVDSGSETDRLADLWSVFGRGLFQFIRINLPFTIYGKSMQAKNEIEAYIRQLIAEKRKQEPTGDALSLLVHAKSDEGEVMSEEELVSQVKLLIFAGYDTTANTLSWLLIEMLRHPEVYERVAAEIRATAGDFTVEDLRRMPYVDAVIDETLRLYPQAPNLMRGVKEEFEFGGYRIPAGWSVMISPLYTQRMPDYFSDPDTFDPDRFLAPREEQKKTPYAWAGFGNGPRICIGEGIARIEIKAMLVKLVRRFDIKLAPDQDLSLVYVPLPRPKGNTDILFTAR